MTGNPLTKVAPSALKVLVVEDLATIRALIKYQLSELGVSRVTAVASGEEALGLLRAEPDFDVILCDWHMTPMDGLRFCALVQATPYLGGRKIPVLFMTGDDRLADPDKRHRALATARDLGIVDILLKPFKAEELLQALVRCGGLSGAGNG